MCVCVCFYSLSPFLCVVVYAFSWCNGFFKVAFCCVCLSVRPSICTFRSIVCCTFLVCCCLCCYLVECGKLYRPTTTGVYNIIGCLLLLLRFLDVFGTITCTHVCLNSVEQNNSFVYLIQQKFLFINLSFSINLKNFVL